MPRIEETAYPRLKHTLSARELATIYTPSWDEATLASRTAKGASARLGFLVLFKTYQRLGYAIPLAEVPAAIVAHIAQSVHLPPEALDPVAYDAAGTRRRHLVVIRDYLGVRPYGPDARHLLIRALGEAARTKGDLIDLINVAIEELVRQRCELPAFDWIPDGWWRLVTGERTRDHYPPRVDRRHFEVCVCMQVFWDLKAGDLSIVGSSLFADHTRQLLPLAEYQRKVDDYCRMLGFPADGPGFVAHVRAWLEEIAESTDRSFPANKSVRIERGEPILTPVAARPEPEGLADLEAVLTARIAPVGVLDALTATAHWLGWHRFFGPLSGHDAKLEEPLARYLSTVFGYGCHISPAELARAIDGLKRQQILWVHHRHISEEALDRAISWVVQHYHRCALPSCWGSARRVGADGTHWALYEDNLLAERHVRYGEFGGIAYYHVAGTYIARFSHFISCGALEGSYILDPFFTTDGQGELPEALHSDTHGQSTTIFGLAFLLGIHLYPRIRGWKKLIWCRPSPTAHYAHVDGLFTETVDWALIETHLPGMLRVALSINCLSENHSATTPPAAG